MSTAPSDAPEPAGPHLASWAGLIDDAAIFPPGNAPLGVAVHEHAEHRRSEYATLLGGFVVSDVRLPELAEILDETPPPAPLRVHVVVTGGAGALAPAVTWAGRAASLELAAVEIALRDSDLGELGELEHNAQRILTARDALSSDPGSGLGEDTDWYVEVPRLRDAAPSAGWLGALDTLAAADIALKFRTGGADADAFPSPAELATALGAALDRELRFKCTAGLHQAVRHRVVEGFEAPVDHHGFLNVLLATRASLDGADVAEVAATLAESDPDRIAARVRELGHHGVSATRRWFGSVGSCSVLEPLEDLVDLGLLDLDGS